MKVKELAKVMATQEFVYIEDPAWGKGAVWYGGVYDDYLVDRFGDRIVSAIFTEHDYDGSAFYIILEEEE